MKTKLYILFFCIIPLSNITAQSYYGGEIHVKQLATYSISATVDLYTSIDDELTTIELCWGDGICEEIPVIYSEEFDDTRKKFYQFEKTHTYFDEATYQITVSTCCWGQDVINITAPETEDFLLKTNFFLSVNEPLFGENFMPTLSRGYKEGVEAFPLVYNSGFSDNEGDAVHFEVCTVENVGTYIPITDIIPGSFNTLLLDTLTNSFDWISPQFKGDYILALCMTETRNNMVISSYTRYILLAIDEPLSNHNIISDHAIKVSPNPSSDQLSIETPDGSTDFHVSAFDATGKKILDQSFGSILDVSAWIPGFYILLIEKDGQLYSEKILVE